MAFYQELTWAISCWPPTPFWCGGSLFSAEFPNRGLGEPPTDENCCCLLFRAFNDSVLVVKTSLKSFVVLKSLPAKQQASRRKSRRRREGARGNEPVLLDPLAENSPFPWTRDLCRHTQNYLLTFLQLSLYAQKTASFAVALTAESVTRPRLCSGP